MQHSTGLRRGPSASYHLQQIKGPAFRRPWAGWLVPSARNSSQESSPDPRFHPDPKRIYASPLHSKTVSGSTPSEPTPPLPYAGKTAVVVGAGPCGSTAAMFLARQGFKVKVYERRPEPEQDAVDLGRAYIIILIPRGQKALDKLGIQPPKDPQHRTKGTVRHDRRGKVRAIKESGNVMFSRSGLAQFLINQARLRAPEVEFVFGAACTSVDLDTKQAFFRRVDADGGYPDDTVSAERYDLLVGCDGVGSSVRHELERSVPGFTVEIDDSGREYKVYKGLEGQIEPPEFEGIPGSSLHLWTTDDPWTTVTAHSDPRHSDGSFSGTFSLQTNGFLQLPDAAAHEALLRSKFKGLPEPWYGQIAAQAAAMAPSPAGKRIRCSQLHGPGVVLLGDSAHGVTPVFGQGANSALESCAVLGRVLEEADGDLEKLPGSFNEARVADVHALYKLDKKAYSFFRRRGPLDPDFLQLLSHVALGTVLSKVVPWLYGRTPLLLQLGSAPYASIMAAVRRDALAAAAIALCSVLALLLKLLGFW